MKPLTNLPCEIITVKQLLPILLSLAMSSVVSAGVTIAIDVDRIAAGTQADFSPTTDFTVDVVLALSQTSDSLASYSFAVVYDTTELTATSASHTPPTGFFDLISADPTDLAIDTGVGQINFPASVTRLTNAIEGVSEFTIGSIDFSLVGAQGNATDKDIEIRFVNNVTDELRDDSNMVIGSSGFSLGAASVSAVPEPNGVVLFSLVVTIMGGRRWRQSLRLGEASGEGLSSRNFRRDTSSHPATHVFAGPVGWQGHANRRQ